MKPFEVHCVLSAVFLLSCLSLSELTLDDPAFREDMIKRVIQGEQFVIDSNDLADIEGLLQDKEEPEGRLAGLILASEWKEDGRFNEKIVLTALDSDEIISTRALWEIEKNPERYRDDLMKLVRSKDEHLRHDGLWITGNVNFPQAQEIYAGSFGDSSKIVRDEASIQFYLSTSREDPLLRELIQSPFLTTAATAYITLARYRNTADLPVIISAINSDILELRLAAKQAVFRFGKLALPLLHPLATNPDGSEKERMAAMELIQAIEADESLDILFYLLDDDNEKIVARAQSILFGYGVQETAVLEEIFYRSDFEVQFQIIMMLDNMKINETPEIIARLLKDMPEEIFVSVLDNLSQRVNNLVLRYFVAEGNEEVARIALKRLLGHAEDPWIITGDGEEINYRAVKLMLKNSSLDEVRSYLNPDLPKVSRLWKESLILLKEVWDASEEFLALEKTITSDRGSYVYIRRLRESYLVLSREELGKSFEELHSYFQSADPASLALSEESRRQSRQLNIQAREQMDLIESMNEETRISGEEQFRRFGGIRDTVIRAWEFCPPELREFFLDIYRGAGLDAEKIAQEYDFQINQ